MVVRQKVVMAIAISAVLVAICAVVIVEVLHGGPSSAQAAIGLIGFMGMLIGLLSTVWGMNQVSSQLNGHLAEHAAAAQQTAQTAVAAAIEAAAQTAANVAAARIEAAGIKREGT